MSYTSANSARERGRLIEMDHAERTRGTTPSVRNRRNRHSPSVLLPRWPKGGISSAAPDGANTSTNGALALLDQPSREATPGAIAARHHILIVEDDSQVASVIHASLELEGEADWMVQSASEGIRALEMAGATPPDVVLLDVRLPGLGGAEVYRRLRASDKTRGALILFLSAGTAFDLHQLGIEDGVLLRKPFDVRNLVGLVRALLDG